MNTALEASGTPCIWQDGLDIPFVNAMEANFFAVHPDLHQKVGYAVDDMTKTWGNPGLMPATGEWSKRYSPMLKYEWAATYDALPPYAKATEGSPFDGVLMKYVNPVTGGHVMQTIGAAMQMLRPGERTKAHRHTGSFIYQVAKGRGHSIIGGKRFEWNERDIFCVPSWMWHEHVNASTSEDACLFSFNDLPVIEGLGLYREEAYGDNGGSQPLSRGETVRLVTYRGMVEAAAAAAVRRAFTVGGGVSRPDASSVSRPRRRGAISSRHASNSPGRVTSQLLRPACRAIWSASRS